MTNLETGRPIRFCWKTAALRAAVGATSVTLVLKVLLLAL